MLDGNKIPAVSGSVSMKNDGHITLTLANVNPNKKVDLEISFMGKSIQAVEEAAVLTRTSHQVS